ncbi:LysM domain/BON superfamily protein [Caulifigura coniformis]|uniref:LysM domain/BON superfamily protein n=1 Tax=Caulifigura coniformis TaxID=2527983 RepID=A0A517S8Z1_9PLAN|nr:LysM peptidoglycan-binding domain-containing protein [Caulifigura coniformis]QDT52604.1 LysM domain/BON superfamily protein [Caulifigura coniformis]
MHRDVKLGLALGILVIGFAAAFCFPRQPATEVTLNPAAGLKLAAIDEDIRLQRRRTFVGDELTPPAQPTLAEPIVEGASLNADLPRLQTAAMRAQEALRSAPDPIRRDVPAPLEEPVLVAETPFVPVEIPVAEPPVEDVFYTVQSGDTLSAVASKTLGSSRKYEAIYEANRDILATPNSLQIGMKLRIPQPAESIARRQPDTSIPTGRSTPPRTPGADSLASREEAVPTNMPRNDEAPISRRGMFSPVRPQQARSGDSIAR